MGTLDKPNKQDKRWLDTRVGDIIVFVIIVLISMVLPPLGALLVFLAYKVKGLSYKTPGLYKPKSVFNTLLVGIALGVVLKLLFKIVIMPMLGAPPVSAAFGFLEQDLQQAILFSFYVIIAAGFSEEIVFRGFVYSKLMEWWGSSIKTQAVIVVLSSLIFGIPHIYQGLHGAIHAGLVGSVLGVLYLVQRRNIWLPIIVHSVYDLTAIYLVYHGLEYNLATLFFD